MEEKTHQAPTIRRKQRQSVPHGLYEIARASKLRIATTKSSGIPRNSEAWIQALNKIWDVRIRVAVEKAGGTYAGFVVGALANGVKLNKREVAKLLLRNEKAFWQLYATISANP